MGGNGPGHGGPEPPHLVHSQTFLVRKSNTHQCQTLCVRLPEASGPSFVSSHYIQESPGGEEGGLEGRGWKTGRGGREVLRGQPHFQCLSGISLEGSELIFPDLVQLICAYCHTR